MKKYFLLITHVAILFLGCGKYIDKKNNDPQTAGNGLQTTVAKIIVADAGKDTIIDIPYNGTGYFFRAILDGRSSTDHAGNIAAYSWREIDTMPEANPYTQILSPASDTTEVILMGGKHKFLLQVRDDQNRIDDDTVTVIVDNKFTNEYPNLPWDSSAGIFRTLVLTFKPDLFENYPILSTWSPDEWNSILYMCNAGESCKNISEWKRIPYIPYDSVNLTNTSLFFTITPLDPIGLGVSVIYANSKSGIDFNKNISIGFFKLK